VRVELVDSTDRFADLENEWRALVEASPVGSPFLTWEWLFAWWTHLRESRRLAIVTVRDRGVLVAVAPFCASRGQLRLFRRWEFLGTGHAGSDYLDAIVRDGFEIDAMRELSALARSRNVALHLDHLAPDARLSTLPAMLAGRGWSFRRVEHGACPYIPLDGHSWDSFLATIGPANRETTRRRFRALERTFAVRFERITEGAARESAVSRLFEFHDARFGSNGTAFQNPRLRAFHRDATDRLCQSQLLRLYTLHLNDDLVAVMYGMSFKRRF
jgi:CelD/BcsL family acetyltransferase involved in cellulose biosynthesis